MLGLGTTFDPLVDFDGMWTTALADRYLPLPELPSARYECIDGRLVISPTGRATDSYGMAQLACLLKPAAGFHVLGVVNLTLRPDTWIQPDVTVLHARPQTDDDDRWIPAGLCTMAVELISKGNRRQDFVNKPKRCAEAGVPYLMQVELVRQPGHASILLLKLVDGWYEPLAAGISGQKFEVAEPFPMSFDPRQLLPGAEE